MPTTTEKPISKRAARKAAAAAKLAADTSTTVAPVAAVVASTRIGGFTLGNIARTAGRVVAGATHFGAESDRDNAYLRLFLDGANDAERMPNGDGRSVTLAALASYGTNPFYGGSAKPHDAGAINRAIKAGHATRSDDGRTVTLTERGLQQARLLLTKATAATTAPAEPVAEPSSEPEAG